MQRLALGALACALAAVPARGRPYDSGGEVFSRGRQIRASVERHVIAGDCVSACTMWLGHRSACIEPDATLWFHAAFYRGSRDISQTGVATLRAFYPPRIRAYVDARGWLNQLALHPMSGATAIALGVPACR